MLSIGKLAAGQADYYLDQAAGRVSRAASVGSGVEDYYVAGNEAPGYWLGAGSRRLGAGGPVDREGLTRVLAGAHPATGAEIVADHARRVPGFDLTFSAPKSVSVLFGLGDEPLRRAIRSEHEAAVADAVGYMERVAARGRRGRGGTALIEGEGFVAAAFRHRTSRAGDPQLHTHVLVANLVEGHDGRWSALDGRGIYQHAKTAGYLYEAALRERLTRRLGVQWTPPRNGIADIDGVPPGVLRAFSRRRAEVEAELRRRGESSAAAARMATLATRRRKDYGVVPDELVGEWRHRAARLGFDRRALRAVLGRPLERPLPVEWERVFARLAGPSGLTRRVSTFTRRNVLQALAAAVPAEAGIGIDGLEKAADRYIASGRAVPVLEPGEATPVIRRRDGRIVYSRLDGRYSTPELLAREREVIETALAGRGCGAGVVTANTLRRALSRRPALADEQRRMVERLTCEGDRVAVVIGEAGTGKTYALDAAREAWEANGTTVLGAAVARRAARELSDGAGIESTSIAALQRRLKLGLDPLPEGSVLVLDEASMVPTRALAEVLRHVVAVNGKLVLAGDHRQLPELEAGGSFRGLARRLPAITLDDNRRQHAAWERRALRELRDGEVGAALQEYQRHGRLAIAEDSASVQRQLVGDWWSAGGPAGGIMIALRRSDVRSLNRLARELMIERGRIAGGGELVIAGEPFSVGDSVVLRQNDSRLGVANGDRGVVRRSTDEGLVVELAGRDVALGRDYVDQATTHGDPVVAHGYAVTGHVAQGLTAERAFVLASDMMYREWAYTAMSRGRHANRLYMVGAADRARDEIAPGSRRTPEEELLAGLRRSRAQLMANDVGSPGGNKDPLRELEEERARIESQLSDRKPRRRLWRRSKDRGRGIRVLQENRLRELDIEAAQLREFTAEPDPPARDQERGIARNSLER